MSRIFQKGFEIHKVTTDKVILVKHKKWCDRKSVSESTKHFTFIAGCKCRMKYKVQDEEENVN